MLLLKLSLRLAFGLVFVGSLLFLPAGTLDWWRAWVYLGAMLLLMLVGSAWFYAYSPGLLEERLGAPVQRAQPLADKIVLLFYFTFYMAWLAFIPLDAFRWHLLEKPGETVSALGLVLYFLGMGLVFLALKENAFAAPVVKHQETRGHKVIDSGVYGVVRHPMYAAFPPIMVGTSLWLQSYAAIAMAALPFGAITVRILLEEAFLRRELPGYEEYMRRVKWRVLPGVW